MTVEAATDMLNDYLQALGEGGDFARFFADQVVWTTMETGEQVQGREAVRDYIVAFHTQMFDAHAEVKGIIVGEGHASLEADFVGKHTAEFAGIPATGAEIRVPYCVVYDLDDQSIQALRAYLPISQLVAQVQAAAS